MRLLSARKSNDAYDQPSELHFIIADSGKNNGVKGQKELVEG